MAEKGAACIVPAIADHKRKVEVARIIEMRMGENHEIKKTSAGDLMYQVTHEIFLVVSYVHLLSLVRRVKYNLVNE